LFHDFYLKISLLMLFSTGLLLYLNFHSHDVVKQAISELSQELRGSLTKESQARETADHTILSALQQYSTSLQNGIKLVSQS
jgi:hypothetical protein